mmetsp:Transcript_30435/g.47666  ORF Transcript_30435/g.47666 Transcript_30435/m.47666 type:complete len:128 (+) Transcript_30435:85-468(+)
MELINIIIYKKRRLFIAHNIMPPPPTLASAVKGLSTITERKDGSSVEGDKVLASRQMRRIIPTVHDSSFQSEMDTLDIFCQGTRLIWFVDDSNLIDCRRISNRISMDKVGVCKVTMQHQYYIEVIHC